MSLFYLYRFKFAVKLQIILFENAIIGHFTTRAVSGLPCWQRSLFPAQIETSASREFQGSFGLVVGKSTVSTRPYIFSLAHPPPAPKSPSPSLFM
jgi:hypothetical protein